MPNWAESMQQTFEYYIVDPGTWKDTTKLTKVESCTITWDAEADTLGSATIDSDEIVEECYIRVYLITIQNGVKEKHPLGTFLVQTPSTNFDGKRISTTMDAYTPLLELKEKYPPIGFFVPMLSKILDRASELTDENTRAPVIREQSDFMWGNDKIEGRVLTSHFVADTNSTWLDFLKDLLVNAKHSFKIDEYGRIGMAPNRELDTLQPVQTYNDDNASILLPSVQLHKDIYGIPNYVEVVCSTNNKEQGYIIKKTAVNDDINSITSIPRRGRKIMHRDTNPSIIGSATDENVQEYADSLLKKLSSVECSVTYTHAYCPVRIGDCVMLNYTRYGLNNIKAKVIRQQIKCVPGCPVTETAVYTTKYWGW